MNLVTININGQEKVFEKGTKLIEISQEVQAQYNEPIVLAKINNKLCELMKKVDKSCSIEFITTGTSDGSRTYKRSCTFLLIKAIKDVLGEEISKTIIQYSISKGYYCETNLARKMTADDLQNIKARMREMISQAIPYNKSTLSTDEAINLFEERGMPDKVKLLNYRKSSTVNVYELDGDIDYFYGYMVPNTSYIDKFELVLYDEGFVIQFPTSEKPNEVAPFVEHNKLFSVFKEASRWASMMNVATVADLNNVIAAGKINELILIQEALQEKKIALIADKIAEQHDKKIILIAGPSSSGKTTFSHRLSIQLKTHGLKPHPIPIDDYFVPRDQTPLDENGNFNFESLEAIDVVRFNKDMVDLLAGKRVELPNYNFKTGKREYKGNFKQLGDNDILVIEGIHALNDKMTYLLPKESKFKVYISALTQLNVDEHNRISTTDGRLIRRIVRDNQYRGISAEQTLNMWSSVNKGERSNIFPYQEEAEAMFNSALIYEIAVLKLYAEPLLFGIPRTSPYYSEAVRLLKFLDYTLSVSNDYIPYNSIIREFIGGSILSV
ncbi:MAG: nucleoside kinase [Clostridiales bacterium]|jgi:uridine kinase|nr:nucleoside kinase [Clostridiales bacterium]